MTVRRLWAVGALALGLVAIVLAIVTAIAHFPSGLAVLACLILAVCCAWLGITRRGAARTAGVAAGALFLAGAVALVVVQARVVEDAIVVVAILAALAAAREAFKAHAHLPPAQRPARPVLFYNPLSGGGKAERFQLAARDSAPICAPRPAGAASNRSSSGAATISSSWSVTRCSRAPTPSRWPAETGRRRSSR